MRQQLEIECLLVWSLTLTTIKMRMLSFKTQGWSKYHGRIDIFPSPCYWEHRRASTLCSRDTLVYLTRFGPTWCASTSIILLLLFHHQDTHPSSTTLEIPAQRFGCWSGVSSEHLIVHSSKPMDDRTNTAGTKTVHVFSLLLLVRLVRLGPTSVKPSAGRDWNLDSRLTF